MAVGFGDLLCRFIRKWYRWNRLRRYKKWLYNERLALAHYSTGF
jgi:predicted alpha/beta hydrolase